MSKNLCREVLKAIIHGVNFIFQNVDSKTGFPVNRVGINSLLEYRVCDPGDMGDYLPFISFAGLIAKDEGYIKWVKDQIRKWNNSLLLPSGFYYTLYEPRKGLPSFLRFRLTRTVSNYDAFEGFLTMYLLNKDPFFLEQSERFAKGICDHSISPLGFVYDVYLYIFNNLKIVHPKATSYSNASYAENMVRLYGATKEKKYLDAAEKIVGAWLSTSTFEDKEIFATRWNINSNSPQKSPSYLSKTNTNMIHSLLTLFGETRNKKYSDAICRTINSLKQKLVTSNGAFFTRYDLFDDRVTDYPINLTDNKAMIDVSIEAYLKLKDDAFLELAVMLANYWINRQSKIGLFPTTIKGDRSKSALVDNNADMIANLIKLYEITENEKYLSSVLSCIKATAKYYPQTGWSSKISIESGAPRSNFCLIKYVGGALKGLSVAYEFLRDTKVIGNEVLQNLARDR